MGGAPQNKRRMRTCPDAPRRATDSEPTEFLCVELESPEVSQNLGNVMKRSDSSEPTEFLDNETAFDLAHSNVMANKRRATRGIRATRTKRFTRTVSCRGISRIAENSILERASLSDSECETPRVSGKALKRRTQSVRVGPSRHRSGRSLRRSGRGLKVSQH